MSEYLNVLPLDSNYCQQVYGTRQVYSAGHAGIYIIYTVLPRCYALLAVTPPPPPPLPIFGRNYCIGLGLFDLNYTPPPPPPPRGPLEPVYGTAVLARVRVLQV